MQEALNVLSKEYSKRVWLQKLDKDVLDDFLKNYRDGETVNIDRLRQDGQLDEYNLQIWISASSDLKLAVFENYVNSHRKGQENVENLDIKAKMNKLGVLQEKVFPNRKEGGFVDEVEPDAGDGREQRSSVNVGDSEIETTGKTLEEQIALYQGELEKTLYATLNPERKEEELAQVCEIFASKRKKVIDETVTEELQKAIENTKKNGGMQKILTQQNAA